MFLSIFLVHEHSSCSCVKQNICFNNFVSSLSVLLLIGRLIVNDVFSIFATSTEERIVERESDPNIEVGHSFKNPGLREYFQIICLFLLSPCLQQGFKLRLVRY